MEIYIYVCIKILKITPLFYMLIKSLLKNLLRYTTYNTWTLLVNVPQELNQYVFCLSRKQKSTKLFDRATVSRPTTLQAHAFHLEVKRWPKKVSYQGKLEIAFFFKKKSQTHINCLSKIIIVSCTNITKESPSPVHILAYNTHFL